MSRQSMSRYGIVVAGEMKSGHTTYLANLAGKISYIDFCEAIRCDFRILRELLRRFDYLCERRFQARGSRTLSALPAMRLRCVIHRSAVKQRKPFCGAAPDAFCAGNARISAVLERIAGVLNRAETRRFRNSNVRKCRPDFSTTDAVRLSPHQIYAPGDSALIGPARVKRRFSQIFEDLPPTLCTL